MFAMVRKRQSDAQPGLVRLTLGTSFSRVETTYFDVKCQNCLKNTPSVISDTMYLPAAWTRRRVCYRKVWCRSPLTVPIGLQRYMMAPSASSHKGHFPALKCKAITCQHDRRPIFYSSTLLLLSITSLSLSLTHFIFSILFTEQHFLPNAVFRPD